MIIVGDEIPLYCTSRELFILADACRTYEGICPLPKNPLDALTNEKSIKDARNMAEKLRKEASRRKEKEER